jgi:cytochrome c
MALQKAQANPVLSIPAPSRKAGNQVEATVARVKDDAGATIWKGFSAMKMIGLTCTAIAAVMLTDAASAALSDSEAKQLMTKYNCQACHAVDKKLAGPGFKDVATKYAGDRSAAERLTQKIGSSGNSGG